jgi:hypothetical protein
LTDEAKLDADAVARTNANARDAELRRKAAEEAAARKKRE